MHSAVAGRVALRSSASSETVGVRTSTLRVGRFLDLLFFAARFRLVFFASRFFAMLIAPPDFTQHDPLHLEAIGTF